MNKQIALPSDHGSWVFLLSPLLIGLFAGGSWQAGHGWLTLAALAVFFLRQPAAALVKTYSGRKSARERPAAWLWLGVYGLIALAAAAGLAWLGQGYLVWLALPGLTVFIWHLWLVRHRQERRQIGVDILAAGALALAAPAAYWIGAGRPDTTGGWLTGGWLLALTWLQSAASIVYAFLRLEQRTLKETPSTAERWRMGLRALLYSGFNLVLTVVAGLAGWLPGRLWLAFGLQFAEVVYGIRRPAIGVKPTAIGFRQLAVSTLFTVLFIILWRIG